MHLCVYIYIYAWVYNLNVYTIKHECAQLYHSGDKREDMLYLDIRQYTYTAVSIIHGDIENEYVSAMLIKLSPKESSYFGINL